MTNYQVNGISGYQGTQELFLRASQATSSVERQKIKEEFLSIFYKEILKQSFKTPNFGGSENSNSVMGMFGSDILVEKLALELAQSKSFSIDSLFPNAVTGRDIVAE